MISRICVKALSNMAMTFGPISTLSMNMVASFGWIGMMNGALKLSCSPLKSHRYSPILNIVALPRLAGIGPDLSVEGSRTASPSMTG